MGEGAPAPVYRGQGPPHPKGVRTYGGRGPLTSRARIYRRQGAFTPTERTDRRGWAVRVGVGA